MSDQQPPADGLPTWWSWHKQPTFWHDAYSDLLSNSATALIIYTVAVLAGWVSSKPLAIIGIVILVGTGPVFLSALVQTVRN